jgi:hypothetical protein
VDLSGEDTSSAIKTKDVTAPGIPDGEIEEVVNSAISRAL